VEADQRRINCLHSDPVFPTHVAIVTDLKDRSVERLHVASSCGSRTASSSRDGPE